MPGSNPFSRRFTLQHPLARMLPLFRYQSQVYRLGEKHPPSGGLNGYGPVWEAVSFVLDPQATLQARVNVQRAFTLLAFTASATEDERAGPLPFRVQLFDTKKQRRLMERGVQNQNFAGLSRSPQFLRDPYEFDQPDSQVLVLVQNFASVANTIQVVLYGQCLRFNEPSDIQPLFPGGNIPSPNPPAGDNSATPSPLSQAVSDFLNNAGDAQTRNALKNLL